ncbi:MAG: hypothetical protein HY017_21640 [Betaproteobacteria bacterium]|nr:hypothetical protein [Betaproteobacteria bacterium]
MHAEIVVPALLPRGNEMPYPAMPALELLLARGRRALDGRCSYEQWIGAACGLGEDNPLPAGALTLLAEGGAPGDAVWLRADPVHLRLGRTDLTVVSAAAFALDAQEADSFADALNAHFAQEFELQAVRAKHWCVRIATMPRLSTHATAEVAGGDVDTNLPQGEDAKHWHALMNEIQMLLHRHPVNEARQARGIPEVNSVWFWGAGKLPGKVADFRWHSVTADDPLARGLTLHAGRSAQLLPASAEAWLSQQPEEGRHLVVLDLLRMPFAMGNTSDWAAALAVLESRWFVPLLDALRGGRIGMITLHSPDGRESLSVETVRGDLRRFWRRAKPLSAYC